MSEIHFYDPNLYREFLVMEEKPAKDEDGYVEQCTFQWEPNLLLASGCEVGIIHQGRLVLRGTLLNKNPRRWRRFHIRYQQGDGTFHVTRMHGPARKWDEDGFMVGRIERHLVKRFRPKG